MENRIYKTVVIGGGAAGVFSAVRCSENQPPGRVLLLEKSRKLLSKVKISGGGRCNVTHSCFDPAELVKNYPRGYRELRGPFTQFQPRDTISWFQERGVEIKKESDGRMFPTTDDSQTIIDCLLRAAHNVEIEIGQHVEHVDRENDCFSIHLRSGKAIKAESIVLATGSAKGGHELARQFGHTIEPPIPSLFTFNIPESPLEHLSGVSVEEAVVALPAFKREYRGPLLITHWGFSGPAILKLSAYCAKELFGCDYQTVLTVDWAPTISDEFLRQTIASRKKSSEKKTVSNDPLVQLPRQLWKALVEKSGIEGTLRWNHLSKVQVENIVSVLKHDQYQISGKTTFKQEFVTCGGVNLAEVNFKTMESKLVPNLYFCGEVLDIDGITGGFNFQAAWTTGWIAGNVVNIK